MKDILILNLQLIFLALIVIAAALFIGKTSFIDGSIRVERPWTAVASLVAMILAFFGK